jgi:hypothetical protein
LDADAYQFAIRNRHCHRELESVGDADLHLRTLALGF